MVSVPILAGALMRFPLGVLSQYIGRKNATMVEMGADRRRAWRSASSSSTATTTCWRWACCSASPAPASAWRCRSARAGSRPSTRAWPWASWAPATRAPCCRCCSRRRWPLRFGWQAVYGVAACAMLLPMVVMGMFAKEPPDREHQTLREHVACLFEKDGWVFSLIYVRHLRRLHRPDDLPADLLLRPVRRQQGAGRPAHDAGGASWARRCAWSGGWMSPTAGAASTR